MEANESKCEGLLKLQYAYKLWSSVMLDPFHYVGQLQKTLFCESEDLSVHFNIS